MTNHSKDELTAVQAVVDRVTSWQDGATEGTVETELRKGLDEVGISLDDTEVGKLADAIQDQHGAVDATAILG